MQKNTICLYHSEKYNLVIIFIFIGIRHWIIIKLVAYYWLLLASAVLVYSSRLRR